MKLLAKTITVLLLLYCLCWAGLAAYFGFAERHKGVLEDSLSNVFGRAVSIQELQTTWIGWSPSLHIKGLRVAGDHPNESALSFESAAMVVSPVSLFTFWPRFTEFAVEKPSLEIVTLPGNRLQVAGITLSARSRPGFNRERLVSWFLNQSNAAWHDGEIRWRKSDGSIQRYSNISFVYVREHQSRSARGTITSPKGTVSAVVEADGNLLSSDDWDASVQLMSGSDQQLLKPGDLSFKVENGMGRVRLSRLSVERIKEFLFLSGLADKARWILDAELSGLLHDVEFSFKGAVMRLSDWSLRASATDVDFKSLDSLPALNNLNGELEASAEKGSFNFTAVNSTFEWSRLYDKSFPITSAQGRFTWRRNAEGAFEVALHQGQLIDPNLSINDINAELTLDQNSQKVSSFGELFTLDSIDELSYQNGDVVVADGRDSLKPLSLDASAKFDVTNMRALSAYLPNVKKIRPFRNWLSRAYKGGKMFNGRASYRGELTPTALRLGKAQLIATADFDAVTIDYAPKQEWPPVTQGSGKAELNNDFLTISPEKLLLNGDRVTDGHLTIENLFSRDILLKLNGKTSTSLEKGMEFLFQGPLIKPAQRLEVLPVKPTSGDVDIDVSLALPLTRLKALSVSGTSRIRDASVMLPEGVPLTDINAVVAFTERTVSSDDISANFLGGQTTAKLVTTAETQPPKMRLTGTGMAKLEQLSPWLGEHLLTWLSGEAKWQGRLDIDGTNLVIEGGTDLLGVNIGAPRPLTKAANIPSDFRFAMNLGGKRLDGSEACQSLQVEYADLLHAEFRANEKSLNAPEPSLFDSALVQVGTINTTAERPDQRLPNGVNFVIDYPQLDIDELLESVIDLAQFEPGSAVNSPSEGVPQELASEELASQTNTDFLDALRSVKIITPAATSMSRPFGTLDVAISSNDGWVWRGDLSGDHIEGVIAMQPRSDVGNYTLDLKKLVIGPLGDIRPPVPPIEKNLKPADYPAIKLTIDSLSVSGRQLGALDFYGRPMGDSWDIEKFALVHNGIRTSATGKWINQPSIGSLSSFDFNTTIEEAEGALNEMDFDGYIRKGRGSIGGVVEWAGAPHEFDYSRLNGKFDLFIKDGELVQVEPGGSGKLLGLLNFNAIARRLIFDFRDVFASGLQFDRMRYRGLLSNGEAILQDAFILTPAVFVRMEGSLNLDKELIDMEVHISPELGGNLTLLSALANPTAGAVVFLTSQLFKDDMRRASFKSYQANGTWEDFEMIEIDLDGNPIASKTTKADTTKVNTAEREKGNVEGVVDTTEKNAAENEKNDDAKGVSIEPEQPPTQDQKPIKSADEKPNDNEALNPGKTE